MDEDKTGPLQRDVGYIEGKLDDVLLRLDQFAADIRALPCRGRAECPAPAPAPKKLGSAEYPKVPRPEAAPGATSVSVDQVIDWMEKLSVARVSQFRRWALLIGTLVVSVVGSTTWAKCNMEERIAALAARPRVLEQRVVLPPGPPTVTIVNKPDAER